MSRFVRCFLAACALSAAPRLFAADALKWRTIPAGEAESKKTGKPVLYFMTADWCGPCKTMKTEIFADPQAVKLIESTYVPIEVLDRRREEGKNTEDVARVVRDYRCQGFPTLTITRPGSKEAFQLPGWISKEATLNYLKVGKDRLAEQEKRRAAKDAQK